MTREPLSLSKYEALGNDFLVSEDIPADPTLAARLCDRRQGVGADGLLLVDREEHRLVLFNADGSSAGFSGNGIRCAALHLALDQAPWSGELELGGRRYGLEVHPEEAGIRSVSVAIPRKESHLTGPPPELLRAVEERLPHPPPCTLVDVGNPHLIFVEAHGAPPPEEALDSFRCGLPGFPGGINVTWILPGDHGQAHARTWERGVGATPSCASAATACTLVLESMGLLSGQLLLHVPGGDLTLEPDPGRVVLSGPVRRVFDARWFP